MAKKSKLEKVALRCSVCKTKNYFTTRNPQNTKDKLELNRYCRVCRKHTKHNEGKVK